MPGSVNFAGWTFTWSIPNNWGGGLVISKANFNNTSVLYKATQPFVLVPYHGNSPHFKDGLNNQGAPYTPVLPTSANAPVGLATPPAGNDNAWDPVTNPPPTYVVDDHFRSAATLFRRRRRNQKTVFQSDYFGPSVFAGGTEVVAACAGVDSATPSTAGAAPFPAASGMGDN